jgi:hypothetical protein
MRLGLRGFPLAVAITLATAAAAADDLPHIGPFTVGANADEIRRSTPNVAWKENYNRASGALVSLSADGAWAIEGETFDAVLRTRHYDMWTLDLDARSAITESDACRTRMLALTAALENMVGPLTATPTRTGGGSVSAQRSPSGHVYVTGTPVTEGELLSAGKDSKIAVETLRDDDVTNWNTHTPSQLPYTMDVTGKFDRATTTCRYKIDITYVPPRSSGDVATNLNAALEPAFIAEFSDTAAARKAWQEHGQKVLDRIGETIYPVPDTAVFKDRAIAALRAKKAATPNAPMHDLIDAAFDGTGDRPGAGINIIRIPNPPAGEQPKADHPIKEKVTTLRQVGGVNVLRIPTFHADTADEATKALQGQDLRGKLIVDLRGNDGGLFDQIVHTAGVLIGGGKLVATVREVNDTMPYKTIRTAEDPALDIVALVDRETDSGAFVLVATLVDNVKARVAGAAKERVNGLIFSAMPLVQGYNPADRSFVKFPTGIILRPNGTPVAEGVKVDLAVTATGDAAVTQAAKAFAKR